MITRVLLAEDDADDRDLFNTFYERRGDISLMPPVTNGVELVDCLTKATTDKDLPDLIVLDQNMPLMNGIQTLRFLSAHARYAQIPTVIYSTYTDTRLIMDCRKLGARMVAVKPIDDEGYQKMMDDFLKVI